MKKQVFLLLVALLAMFSSAFAYDFSAAAPSGQTLFYNIVNGEAHVVRPGSGSSYNNYVTGALTIPSSVTYNGTTYSVTALEPVGSYGTFERCSGLTSITIPGSVNSIGIWAFYNCSGLTSVNYTGTIAQWCNIAFGNITSNPVSQTHSLNINGSPVTNLVIPDSVTSIGQYAFYQCTGLTSVTIGSGVTSIGQYAFNQCTGLTSVTIGSSVTLIDQYAFYQCTGLTSVTIPNSVISIGKNAFRECAGLTSVTIGSSVTSIGEGAFGLCSGLTSLTVPNSVTSIGGYAFQMIKNIVYHGSATGSPWGAISVNGETDGVFVYSDSTRHYLLAYIGAGDTATIPSTIDTIGECAFQYCRGLISVTIPNSVTSIGYGAFRNCNGLTSVTIPNSVTSIGDYAFYQCTGLTSVTIGNGSISIGNYAYNSCDNLDTVYMMPTFPPALGINIFGNNNSYGGVIILNGCSYNSYYTTNSSNRWYYYRSALRDPIYDITITVLPNNTARGTATVIAGRSNRLIRCDSTAVISATANNSAHFDHWTGGSTATPDTIALVGDSTITAYFIALTVTSCDNTRGTVSRTKIGNHLERITATAITGYHFDHWSNGSTANPDTITITSDSTVTAYFLPNQYTLIMSVNDSTLGTFTNRSGTYNYLDTVIVSATCTALHHHFVNWSDGSSENPHTVTITGDMMLTANFAIDSHFVNAHANDSSYGVVYGGGYHPYGSTVTLHAMPNDGHLLLGWNNDTTNNPYTITVEGDYSVEALFTQYCVPSICMVSVQNNHNLLIWDDSGVEVDLNIYREGLTTGAYDLVATIPYGQGTQWIDEGSRPMNHSYRYKMTAIDQYGNETPYSEVHLTMHLTINQGVGNSWNLVWAPYEGADYSSYQIYRGSNQYNMELIDQMASGGVTTYADYNVNLDTVYYQVVIVKDEPCYNTKSLNIIRSNIATNGIVYPEGIGNIEADGIRIYSADGRIVVEGATDEVRVFDMMGRRVRNNALPAGVYLVKVGDYPARKVVVVR